MYSGLVSCCPPSLLRVPIEPSEPYGPFSPPCPPPPRRTNAGTIWETLASDPSFSLLTAALNSTDLARALDAVGGTASKYTLFAPDDEAIKATSDFPEGTFLFLLVFFCLFFRFLFVCFVLRVFSSIGRTFQLREPGSTAEYFMRNTSSGVVRCAASLCVPSCVCSLCFVWFRLRFCACFFLPISHQKLGPACIADAG